MLSETGPVLHTAGPGGNDAEVLLDRLALVRPLGTYVGGGPSTIWSGARRRGSLVVITGTGRCRPG